MGPVMILLLPVRFHYRNPLRSSSKVVAKWMVLTLRCFHKSRYDMGPLVVVMGLMTLEGGLLSLL